MYTFAFANTAFYFVALWTAFAQSRLAAVLMHYPRLCWDSISGNPRTGEVITALYIVDDFTCTPIEGTDEFHDDDVGKSLVVFYTWQHQNAVKEYAIMRTLKGDSEDDMYPILPECGPAIEPADKILSVCYDSNDVTQAYNQYAGPSKDFYAAEEACVCELIKSRMVDRHGVFLFDGSERCAESIDIDTLPDKGVIEIFGVSDCDP